MAFLDGSAYRIWDLRYDPALGHFSPGRVLTHRILERVLADSDFNELDWMNGEEPYKLAVSNVVVPYQELRAWSSRRMQQIDGWLERRRHARVGPHPEG